MGKTKYNISFAENIVKSRGGHCLSSVYKNTKDKMLWQCEQNHKWYASLEKIKYGRWCPYCAKNKKLSIEECNKLASSKNGKCITRKYTNAHTKLLFECKNNHRWRASYANVYSGKWCPICAGVSKNNLTDCFKLAESHGGKCLSIKYVNATTIMQWKCSRKHKWNSTYNNIQRGQWCPECNTSKVQNKLFSIIRDIFFQYEAKQNFTDFVWLKSKKGRKQEIDIFVYNIKLAIEYDGIQHYKPTRFGGISQKRAEENLKYTKKLDKLKNKKIKQNPEDVKYFIRFNYLEKKKLSKEYVMKKLTDNNILIGEINE